MGKNIEQNNSENLSDKSYFDKIKNELDDLIGSFDKKEEKTQKKQETVSKISNYLNQLKEHIKDNENVKKYKENVHNYIDEFEKKFEMIKNKLSQKSKSEIKDLKENIAKNNYKNIIPKSDKNRPETVQKNIVKSSNYVINDLIQDTKSKDPISKLIKKIYNS